MKYSEFNPEGLTKLPIITIIGPVSSGKTTFIQHFFKLDFDLPIGEIGTTSKFTVFTYSDELEEGTTSLDISGNQVVSERDSPIYGIDDDEGLEEIGNQISGYLVENERLKDIVVIDTPGIQSREKSYDFIEAERWFIARSSLVIMLLDAFKVDLFGVSKTIGSVLTGVESTDLMIVLNRVNMIKTIRMANEALEAVSFSLRDAMPRITEMPQIFFGKFGFEDEETQPHFTVPELQAEAEITAQIEGAKRKVKSKRIERLGRHIKRFVKFIQEITRFQKCCYKETSVIKSLFGVGDWEDVCEEKCVPEAELDHIEMIRERIRESVSTYYKISVSRNCLEELQRILKHVEGLFGKVTDGIKGKYTTKKKFLGNEL